MLAANADVRVSAGVRRRPRYAPHADGMLLCMNWVVVGTTTWRAQAGGRHCSPRAVVVVVVEGRRMGARVAAAAICEVFATAGAP